MRSTHFVNYLTSVFRFWNGPKYCQSSLTMNNHWLKKGEQRQNFCSRGLLLLLFGYLNKPKNKIVLSSVIFPKAYEFNCRYIVRTTVHHMYCSTSYVLQYILPVRATVHPMYYSTLYVLQYILHTTVHFTQYQN